jgi:hypothetical protein
MPARREREGANMNVQAQVFCLARFYARKAVKANWQAQGLKPQQIKVDELMREADVYLDAHPELIDFAATRHRDFIKRSLAQRKRTRRSCAALNTLAQKPKP